MNNNEIFNLLPNCDIKSHSSLTLNGIGLHVTTGIREAMSASLSSLTGEKVIPYMMLLNPINHINFCCDFEIGDEINNEND